MNQNGLRSCVSRKVQFGIFKTRMNRHLLDKCIPSSATSSSSGEIVTKSVNFFLSEPKLFLQSQ